MRIENKIVLITGAASAIGESCARLFIQEGAIVILADIQDEKGELLAKELGLRAVYKNLDVKNENKWMIVFDFIKKEYGKLDVLINNAGIAGLNENMGPQDPEHASLESWQYIHSINLDSVFLGCKYAIPLMKEHGGSIINMSSRSGIVGVPRDSAYASSKAAIRNHTKSVALYCAEERYNIRCNSIHPAAILTPIWNHMLGQSKETRQNAIQMITKDIPLKVMGEPIDVAYAALYLASDESKYITGTELIIDGGILAGSAASPK